jgi:hypothetical protein
MAQKAANQARSDAAAFVRQLPFYGMLNRDEKMRALGDLLQFRREGKSDDEFVEYLSSAMNLKKEELQRAEENLGAVYAGVDRAAPEDKVKRLAKLRLQGLDNSELLKEADAEVAKEFEEGTNAAEEAMAAERFFTARPKVQKPKVSKPKVSKPKVSKPKTKRVHIQSKPNIRPITRRVRPDLKREAENINALYNAINAHAAENLGEIYAGINKAPPKDKIKKLAEIRVHGLNNSEFLKKIETQVGREFERGTKDAEVALGRPKHITRRAPRRVAVKKVAMAPEPLVAVAEKEASGHVEAGKKAAFSKKGSQWLQNVQGALTNIRSEAERQGLDAKKVTRPEAMEIASARRGSHKQGLSEAQVVSKIMDRIRALPTKTRKARAAVKPEATLAPPSPNYIV